MTVKASKVIGLKVVSLREGENIENVNDVIYDPSGQKVRALLVDPGGWFSGAKVIPLDRVRNIGRDAVTVPSAEVIEPASELPEPNSGVSPSTSRLRKMNVLTESGTDLGRVSDIEFNPKTGEVVEFEVSRGAVEDLRSGRKRLFPHDILRVGVDDIIVKDEVEKEFAVQGKKGGARGAAKKAGAEAEKGATGVSEKAKEAGAEAQAKAEEVTEQPEVQNVGESLRRGTESFADSVQRRYEEIRTDMRDRRIRDAVGQYLDKTILLPDDQILANKGEMITHETIRKAEANGLLEQILDHASSEPPKG